jgi:methyl-accepting chemotaxis protein
MSSALIEACRRKISAIVEKVVRTSEKETLEVGRCVTMTLDEARCQVDELRRILAQVDRGSGEANVASLIHAQSRSMTDFVAEISNALRAQDAAVIQAVAQSNKIIAAGATIEHILTESKILAVNALIEAARLGVHGASMKVIAQNMKELSASVEKVNAAIAQIAKDLSAALPTLGESVKTMLDDTESFGRRFEGQLSDLDARTQTLTSSVESSLNESEARAARILAASQEAISHLQYQDPMAQLLRKIVVILDALDTGEARTPDREEAPGIAPGEVNLF